MPRIEIERAESGYYARITGSHCCEYGHTKIEALGRLAFYFRNSLSLSIDDDTATPVPLDGMAASNAGQPITLAGLQHVAASLADPEDECDRHARDWHYEDCDRDERDRQTGERNAPAVCP